MIGEPAPALAGRVSVVMVSYYTGPQLFPALDAALAQPEVAELVLVDNGNPEPVRRELSELAEAEPHLVLVQGQGNLGFARACNIGARRARGEYLLLLNPDCLMPPGGVARLLAEGRRRETPWLIGPRLLNPDGSEQAGGRRRVLTPWRAFVEIFHLYRLPLDHSALQRFNLHLDPLPDGTSPVEVISGACMLMPAVAYRALDGMDEAFFLHVEDIDFCLRFGALGGVYFCPWVSVPHGKGTSAASALKVEWHKTRGFFRYFRKHFSGRYVPGFIPLVDLAIFLRFHLLALRHVFRQAIAALGKSVWRRGT